MQNSKLSVQIETNQRLNLVNSFHQRNFAFILVDSFKSFLKIDLQFSPEGFYLVVLMTGLSSEIQQMFQLFWNKFIYNVNILVEDGNKINLITFIPFNSRKCGDTSPKVINSFVLGQWLTREFFPNKIKNLQHCTIKIQTFEYGPAVLRTLLSNGTYNIFGSDIDLIYSIAESLNFRIDLRFMDEAGSFGLLFTNGTSTGAMNKVMTGEVDLIMGMYSLRELRTKFMSFTIPYGSNSMVIIIPPGFRKSTYQLLLGPFENIVWYCFLGTCAFGILVIVLVKFQSDPIKNFIFGYNVKNPLFNMLIILFEGEIVHLPKRNFSRFLLTSFILFCLIQRTLYQGSLYQFLQSQNRMKEVSSIQEMVDKDFIFYMSEATEQSVRELNPYKKRQVIGFGEFPAYREKALDPTFKGGVLNPAIEIAYWNKLNRNISNIVCKEVVFTNEMVFYFQKGHYLVHEFNEKIAIFKEAGLTEWWLANHLQSKLFTRKNLPTGPKTLTIQELLGVFEACAYCLNLAGFVLILELLYIKLFRNQSIKKILSIKR
ncbi:unnamed protein product [Diamesa serratosioi]